MFKNVNHPTFFPKSTFGGLNISSKCYVGN